MCDTIDRNQDNSCSQQTISLEKKQTTLERMKQERVYLIKSLNKCQEKIDILENNPQAAKILDKIGEY